MHLGQHRLRKRRSFALDEQEDRIPDKAVETVDVLEFTEMLDTFRQSRVVVNHFRRVPLFVEPRLEGTTYFTKYGRAGVEVLPLPPCFNDESGLRQQTQQHL